MIRNPQAWVKMTVVSSRTHQGLYYLECCFLRSVPLCLLSDLFPLLWAILSCSHLGFFEGQDWWLNICNKSQILHIHTHTTKGTNDFLIVSRPQLTNPEKIIHQPWSLGPHGHVCLTVHTAHHLTQFFLYLNLQFMPMPWKWAEMLTLPLPMLVAAKLINLVSLPFTTISLL
jgi:hypothetical protein